jgi:hypothetical protein
MPRVPDNPNGVILNVQIQKEVISNLKRENQFLSKEIWESICVLHNLSRDICKPVLKLDFTGNGIMVVCRLCAKIRKMHLMESKNQHKVTLTSQSDLEVTKRRLMVFLLIL